MSVNFVNNQRYVTDGLAALNDKAATTNGSSNLDDVTVPATNIEVVAVKESSQLKLDESKESIEEQTESQVEPSQLTDAVKTIADFISLPIRSVNFTHDDGSEKTVIKIFDKESKELIKQFPSEEILAIAQRIVELRQDVSQKTGILLDESI